MRVFAPHEVELLRDYVPAALVLPLQLALRLADQKQRRLLDIPVLSTAVVVLSSVADGPMADDHRDLLWRAFGVPVFEQLRDRKGLVIARECEVHDGLHIDDAAALGELAGVGEIIRSHCECGAETPRLMPVKPVRAKVMLAAAS